MTTINCQVAKNQFAKEMGMEWKSDGSLCPTCCGAGRGSTRYPAALCEACQASVVDVNGRHVRLFNEGFSGGLEIEFFDDNKAVDPEDVPLYSHGVECRAREHRFGGGGSAT